MSPFLEAIRSAPNLEEAKKHLHEWNLATVAEFNRAKLATAIQRPYVIEGVDRAGCRFEVERFATFEGVLCFLEAGSFPKGVVGPLVSNPRNADGSPSNGLTSEELEQLEEVL